jgi:hypothetical protein
MIKKKKKGYRRQAEASKLNRDQTQILAGEQKVGRTCSSDEIGAATPTVGIATCDMLVRCLEASDRFFMFLKTVKKVVRISLVDRHVGGRPHPMRVPVRERFVYRVIGALIDLEPVVVEPFSILDDCIGVIEANPNSLVFGASLCSGCSGARFTFALEMGLSSSIYS